MAQHCSGWCECCNISTHTHTNTNKHTRAHTHTHTHTHACAHTNTQAHTTLRMHMTCHACCLLPCRRWVWCGPHARHADQGNLGVGAALEAATPGWAAVRVRGKAPSWGSQHLRASLRVTREVACTWQQGKCSCLPRFIRVCPGAPHVSGSPVVRPHSCVHLFVCVLCVHVCASALALMHLKTVDRSQWHRPIGGTALLRFVCAASGC